MWPGENKCIIWALRSDKTDSRFTVDMPEYRKGWTPEEVAELTGCRAYR
ncbi:hypothetical protein [Methanosarcina mazei]|nr:hypothetical protein [Methanosarcina mazei]